MAVLYVTSERVDEQGRSHQWKWDVPPGIRAGLQCGLYRISRLIEERIPPEFFGELVRIQCDWGRDEGYTTYHSGIFYYDCWE